jgi:hypothetical protein
MKLATQPNHLSYGAVLHPTLCKRFEINTSSLTRRCALSPASAATNHPFTAHYSLQAPSNPTGPNCDVQLIRHPRGAKSVTYHQCFVELLSFYPVHISLYTNGLFLNESTGSAFIYDSKVFSYHLFNFIM